MHKLQTSAIPNNKLPCSRVVIDTELHICKGIVNDPNVFLFLFVCTLADSLPNKLKQHADSMPNKLIQSTTTQAVPPVFALASPASRPHTPARQH